MDDVARPALTAAEALALPSLADAGVQAALGPPGGRFPSRAALTASGMLSLALHAAAALAVLSWGRSELGVVPQPTEAISLELMPSSVIEQAAADARDAASAAAAAVAQQAGAATESAAPAALSEVKPAEVLRAEPAAEVAPAPQQTDAVVAAVAPTETVIAGTAEAEESLPPPAPPTAQPARPPERKPEPQPVKPRTEKMAALPRPPAETPKEGARPSRKGGAPSRASTGAAPGAGRVSASAGDIMGYAARVRARVAGNRPSGRGQRGTAVVSFGVSRSGGLTYVRLSRSSGAAALDQAALAAVRRSAPFPPPPAGAPASRLAFSVPFYFR